MIQLVRQQEWERGPMIVSFASRRLTNTHLALTANHGLEQEKGDPMIYHSFVVAQYHMVCCKDLAEFCHLCQADDALTTPVWQPRGTCSSTLLHLTRILRRCQKAISETHPMTTIYTWLRSRGHWTRRQSPYYVKVSDSVTQLVLLTCSAW